MRKKGLVLFVTIAVLLMFCISAHAFKVPDTGQELCYGAFQASSFAAEACEGTGQDGAYTINAPSYTQNGDGTITDNNTGLMWQQQDDGNTYTWYEASGTANATYNKSSLDVCGSLTLAGYSDWRLPAFNELVSIVDYSIALPGPTIDSTIFTDTKQAPYWASEVSAAYAATYAWALDFYYGWGKYMLNEKKAARYVRCVRGVTPEQNLVDNSNGTVTDKKTGLMWQQQEPGSLLWGNAIAYCEGLSLGGYSDWRMPTVKELAFLMDYSKFNPAMDRNFFPNVPTTECYSYGASTNYAANPASHWQVESCAGTIETHGKDNTSPTFIKCVRGGEYGGTFDITARAAGTGAGNVTSSPTGISYKYPATASMAASFSSGATVTLTATADTGSNATWGGTCTTAGGTETGSGTANATCSIIVANEASMTATFSQLSSKITARAKGAGAGSVVSAPAGISYKYPARKTAFGNYKNASTVKISAKAKAGSKASWNNTCKKAGGTEKGDNTRTAVCTLKVKKAATVTATFKK
jgi:hypothetical protein